MRTMSLKITLWGWGTRDRRIFVGEVGQKKPEFQNKLRIVSSCCPPFRGRSTEDDATCSSSGSLGLATWAESFFNTKNIYNINISQLKEPQNKMNTKQKMKNERISAKVRQPIHLHWVKLLRDNSF